MKKFVLLTVVFALTACSIVGPGQRGVRISLGSVSEDAKAPGGYLWIPFFLGMKKIDVQIQKSEIQAAAASKDMQEINAVVAVNWSLNPEKVVEIYKTIGDEDDVHSRILVPAVAEVIKSATAKRTAEEVLTKRIEMKDDIDAALKQRLGQYGISVMDISIVNLAFSQEFTTAIERKQIAEQEAQQAAYDTKKAIQTAQAEIERAKGTAQAQSLLKSTITQEILQQQAIEKWNGTFPQYMGSGALPFINLK